MWLSNLETPQRQEPLGVIIMFLMNLKKWWQVIVVFAIPYITGSEQKISFIGFLSISLLLVALWSYLSWKNFFFHVADQNFVINEGVFKKEETIIPLERIQSVQLKQNFIQQIINLTSVTIDTAGSGKKEAEIAALKQVDAQALKAFLMTKKEVKSSVSDEPVVENYQPLMQFTVADILRVGLTENHLKGALLLLGVFGYLSQYSDYLGLDDDELWEESFQYITTIIPIFSAFFIITSVLMSLWKSFLKYFNLMVILKNEGISVKSGLFKVEESFVPLKKIQYIKWKSNPLRKLIGFKSLGIYQASPVAVKQKKAITIPGCKTIHRQSINEMFYPEMFTDDEVLELKPDKYWTIRLLLIFELIPLIIMVLIYFFAEPIMMIAPAIYSLLAPFFIVKYASKFKVLISKDLIQIQRGFVFTEKSILHSYKVQNVQLKQSIFQKQSGLVSLKLFTASGSMSIPYISEITGTAFFNKLIFDIESSAKSWM